MRYLSHGEEQMIGEGIVYKATTTDRYYRVSGVLRRLLVDHNVKGWTWYGIWQSNVECEIIESK